MSKKDIYLAEFEEFKKEYGIRDEDNLIEITPLDQHFKKQLPFFSVNPNNGNLIINYYDLEGSYYTCETNSKSNPIKQFYRERIRDPKGDNKYWQLKGSPVYPYFPLITIDTYHKGEQFDTLYIPEGEKKAFILALLGIRTVGIPSIHGYKRGKGDKNIHHEILQIVEKCKVKNIVLLLDADTFTIKWEPGKDLAKRPNTFLAAVSDFKQSLDGLLNNENSTLKEVYFMALKPELVNETKGIDDLLIAKPEEKEGILKDLLSLNRAKKYFDVIHLSDSSKSKLKKRFGVGSVVEFGKVYGDFLENRNFVWHGKNFKFDHDRGKYIGITPQKETSELMLITAGELERYADDDSISQWRTEALRFQIIRTPIGYYKTDIKYTTMQITMQRISNFCFYALFHIPTTNNKAKRILEIKNEENAHRTIDIDSATLTKLGTTKELIEANGNFLFWGSATEHERLKSQLYDESKHCTLIDTLGHFKDGFFVFSNGIFLYDSAEFVPVSQHGTVEIDSKYYYIECATSDSEYTFVAERKFKFENRNDIEFQQFFDLFHKVYGHSATCCILFLIVTLISDEYLRRNKNFPMLFFYGDGGSGKSTMANVILHFFGKETQTPLKISERANTDKGKMRKLAQFINGIISFEEYTNAIDSGSINQLKGIYDRIGYERATMGGVGGRYSTETIPINSGVIMTGNEYPHDEPLMQRLLFVEQSKNVFDESPDNYNKLLTESTKGLSSLLIKLLSNRAKLIESFFKALPEAVAELSSYEYDKQPPQRMINNFAVLAAATQAVKAIGYSVPGGTTKFLDFLKFSIENQVQKITGENVLERFWDIFRGLNNQNRIVEDRDFVVDHIEQRLYLSVNSVYNDFAREFKSQTNLPAISKNELRKKLLSAEYFVEEKKNKRFPKRDNPTSAIVLNFDALDLSLVTRYEIV